MTAFRVIYGPTNPVIVCQRKDLSLSEKGLYFILTCMPRKENESDQELIERLTNEEDWVVEDAYENLKNLEII